MNMTDIHGSLIEPSIYEENKIDDLITGLYSRVQEETERLLRQQLLALGVDFRVKEDIKKIIFPNDPQALAIYEYKGQKILGLRISDNGMGVEFDIPKITNPETQGGPSDGRKIGRPNCQH